MEVAPHHAAVELHGQARVALHASQVAAEDRTAPKILLLPAGRAKVFPRHLEIALGNRRLGHFAAVVRDRARLLGHADGTQALVHRRGLRPVVLEFVDADEVRQRHRGFAPAVGQLQEQLLGMVVEPGTEIVARELGECGVAILRVEPGAGDDVLVDANRAVDLAAPPVEAAECEVRVDRLLVERGHA